MPKKIVKNNYGTWEIITDENNKMVSQKLIEKRINAKKDKRAVPTISLSNFISASSALLFGKGVSDERKKKRLEICYSCEYLKNEDKSPQCGICGCRLNPKLGKLLDLTRYEETKRYGCKHPKGSRWKAKGV